MVAVQVTSDPYVGQTATILSFIVSFTHPEETAQLPTFCSTVLEAFLDFLFHITLTANLIHQRQLTGATSNSRLLLIF